MGPAEITERVHAVFQNMGRKGKRVHEQSAGSSTPAGDYETIRLIPTQNQDATGTGSSLPSGISAPPDPPESGADTTRPPVGPNTCPLRQKCQYCSLSCCRCDSTHVLHRCKQHVNW